MSWLVRKQLLPVPILEGTIRELGHRRARREKHRIDSFVDVLGVDFFSGVRLRCREITIRKSNDCHEDMYALRV
jgi:hypothetical protein